MFNHTKRPKKDTIKPLLEHFQRTGDVNHDHIGNFVVLRASIKVEANVKVVQSVVQKSLLNPVHHIESQAGVQHTSTDHIIRHNLGMFPYKFQTRQPRSAVTISARATTLNSLLFQLHVEKVDMGNICFFDLEYFALDSFARLAWYIWGIRNSHFFVQSSLRNPLFHSKGSPPHRSLSLPL